MVRLFLMLPRWSTQSDIFIDYADMVAPILLYTGGSGVDDLALDPAKKGQNQSRHLAVALDCKHVDGRLYEVPTLLWNDHASKLVDGRILMFLPHEMMGDVDVKDLNTRFQDPETWDYPAFKDHLVCQAYGRENVFPLTVYADATPFRANDADSFYAVYIQIAPCTQILL